MKPLTFHCHLSNQTGESWSWTNSRRMSDFFRPRLWILALLLIGGSGLVFAKIWRHRAQPRVTDSEWLPTDIPCALIHDHDSWGNPRRELVVDVPIAPDSPVQFLISALGPAHFVAEATVSVEEISADQIQFRPEPLSEGIRVSATNRGADSCPQSTLQPSSKSEEFLQESQSDSDLRLPASACANRTETFNASTSPHREPATSRKFWIHVMAHALEDCRGYQHVMADLACVRDTVQVYVDHSLAGAADVQQRAITIAEVLQRDVLPAINEYIGPIRDVGGDRRLTVLLTPWLSRLQGGMTQVKGFVRGTDFQPELEPPYSNQAAVLYLNTDLPTDLGLKTLLLHEVAHAAIFSQWAMKPPGSAPVEDWINEGLAHLAERRLGGDWSNLDYRIARFYQRPEASPLAVADYYRSSRWRDHGCRGASFLFFDQFGTSPGSALPALNSCSQRLQSYEQQAEFERHLRHWAISLARSAWRADASQKLGRFLNSGPRFQVWNTTEQADFALQVTGTATQYIELTSIRPAWFRLRIPSGVDAAWQATVLRPPPGRPDVSIMTRWQRESASGFSPNSSTIAAPVEHRLVATLSSSLPPGWSWSAVAIEATEGNERLVNNWELNAISSNAGSKQPYWLDFGRQLSLPPFASPPQTDRILKARLRGPDGRNAWIWAAVPPLSDRHSHDGRSADLHSPNGRSPTR